MQRITSSRYSKIDVVQDALIILTPVLLTLIGALLLE